MERNEKKVPAYTPLPPFSLAGSTSIHPIEGHVMILDINLQTSTKKKLYQGTDYVESYTLGP